MSATELAYNPNDDQGPKIVTVLWVVACVPILFVALRFWVRLNLSHGYGWDDTVIAVSSVILIAYAVVITEAVRYGVGRHYTTISPLSRLVLAYKFTFIGQPLAIVACSLSKTSFALTMLRIVTQKWEKVMLWYIIISVNLVMFLCALFEFIQCSDPRHNWDRSIPATCWPVAVFTWYAVFAGAYAGACDFVLAIYPWIFLRKLQMQNRERIAVGFAMSLGLFAGCAAVVKTQYLPALSEKADYTWAGSDVLIWGGAETGLTIVASCIGTYRPLLKKVIAYASNNSNNSRSHDKYYVLEKLKIPHSRPRSQSKIPDAGSGTQYRTTFDTHSSPSRSDRSFHVQGGTWYVNDVEQPPNPSQQIFTDGRPQKVGLLIRRTDEFFVSDERLSR